MMKEFSVSLVLILAGVLVFSGYGWGQTKGGSSDMGTSSSTASDTSKSKDSSKSKSAKSSSSTSSSDMGSSGMDMSKDSQKGSARSGGSENVKKVQEALKDKG